MHDEDVRFTKLQYPRRHPVETGVLAPRRQLPTTHPLELDSQHHDDVLPLHGLFEIEEHLHAEILRARRDERRRPTDRHVGAHGLQRVNVRAGHAAVRDVAHNENFATLNFFSELDDRHEIEQRLGRVLVKAVTRVHHRNLEHLIEKVRRSRRRVPENQNIGRHGLDRLRGIVKRLTLFRGAHLFGERQHVPAEPFGRQLEGAAGPGTRLEEEENDRPVRERGRNRFFFVL